MKHLLIIAFVTAFTLDTMADETSNPLGNWGFDIGFGQQAYVEDVYKVGILTPYLFSWAKDRNHSRLTLEYNFKEYQSIADSANLVQEVTLFFRTDASIFKEVVSAYSKIGIGAMIFDDDLYDGTPLTLPVALGLNVIVEQSGRYASTIYVEYQLNTILNYEDESSLPGDSNTFIESDVFSTNAIMIGTNFFF